MSKKVDPAISFHDFYKSNGMVHEPVMPGGPSMTRQEFAEECDINTIMSRYDAYLSDPMKSVREPMYIDFTELPDSLMGTMALVQAASDAFYTLPAVVRREFDNDPVMFADYAADPTNVEQMREWGLAKPLEAPVAPQKVEVVNPQPGPAEPLKAPAGASTHVPT